MLRKRLFIMKKKDNTPFDSKVAGIDVTVWDEKADEKDIHS